MDTQTDTLNNKTQAAQISQNGKKEIPSGTLDKLGNTLLGQNPFSPKIQQKNSAQTSVQKSPDNRPSKVQEFMKGKFANSPIKPLRTYRSDVEETVQQKKESATTIILAEKKRRERRGEKEKYKKQDTAKNSIIVFLTIALIVTGTGSLFIFLYAKSQEQKAVVTFYRQTIVPAEKEEKINIQKGMLSSLIQEKITTLSLEEGDVAFLNISSNENELSAEKAISEISPSVPSYFSRSLKDYMFGISKQGNNNFFILMKTDSFENGFSGMLEWEKTITEDLGPLFFNTASSTVINFVDTVIKNKDVRVVRNARREIIFMYVFLDKETILITGNEKVFNNILNRYFNSKLVQ